VLGAPKIGDHAAWGGRKSKVGGLDGLVKSAAAGKGNMPPRGGDASLSDAELKAAVEQMTR
jgi:cytochrome c5